MYEDTSMRAEEETNIIRKIEEGERKQSDLTDERIKLGKFAILILLVEGPWLMGRHGDHYLGHLLHFFAPF